MFKRDYRLKVNLPSGTIADSDTFTFDRSSRMLTGISGRYVNTVTMTYAANDGRLAYESLTIGGQTYTVGRTYDARGQLFQMTYPNGAVVERAYTDRGQLNKVKYKDTAGGTLNTEDTRTYDLGGRLSTSAYRNGVATTYTYRSSGSQKDDMLASISFAHPAGVTSNDEKVGTHTYAWDANKNKSSETITGAATAYINFGFTTAGGSDPDGYDDEDRLVYFKRTGTTNPQSWNLSLVGDWNSYSDFGTNQNRTHGPSHEILTAGATPNNVVIHDVKGNITDIPTNISSPARKLFWDFDNRLKGIDNTGDSVADVTYEFDALGRRVARTEGPTAVVYISAGQQVIADYARGSLATASPLYRYVYGDYIDEPILRQTGTTSIHYYHHNQQYSTIALTTSTGAVTERYAYSPCGQVTVLTNTGTSQAWSVYSNRYSYTGREWDENVKLLYFRARWYETNLGRFIQRDQFGYFDGFNLYSNHFAMSTVDSSGNKIYAVDGTSAVRGDGSNVNRFVDNAIEPAYYHDGPQRIDGADSAQIRGEVLSEICHDWCEANEKCVELEINLVGWSRGASILLDIAHHLNGTAACLCPKKPNLDSIPVNFFGMFDMVNMTTVIPVHTEIPSNVANNAHAIKTAFEIIFPTQELTNDTERRFLRNDGSRATHADLGRRIDNNKGYEWIREQAQAAGVEVK